MITDRNTQIITDGRIYALFANIFAKEPTAELLELLQSEENGNLFKSYGIDPLSDIKAIPFDKQRELLSTEYARLFLAPSALVSPYESIERSEGRLWGESTVEVNNIYKKFGFELDENFKEAPDHISAELAFLQELSGLEAKYEDSGLMEAKKGVIEVKKYFLKNHLLKWFSEFHKKISEYAEFAYYREMASLLNKILDQERQALT